MTISSKSTGISYLICMRASEESLYTLAHSTLVPIFLTTTKRKPQTAVCGLQYIPKSLNIVKQKEHLTFNHALKRTEILPKSLRFNPPVNCKERFKITKKAGRSFLNLRIQSSHQKVKQLGEQCSNLVRKLSLIISQEHFDALSKVVSHNATKLKEKVKNRHS